MISFKNKLCYFLCEMCAIVSNFLLVWNASHSLNKNWTIKLLSTLSVAPFFIFYRISCTLVKERGIFQVL